MNLHEIANAKGYGTGKRAREIAAAENEVRDMLPETHRMPSFMASDNSVAGWLIASFGNCPTDGKDWHLVTDHMKASDLADTEWGDARTDAQMTAAILNAYRMGILVVSEVDEAVGND